MEEKYRTIHGPVETSVRGASFVYTPFVFDLEYDERTRLTSRSHQVVHTQGNEFRLLGRTKRNIGGPFASWKIEIDLRGGDGYSSNSVDCWNDSDGYNAKYMRGTLVPNAIQSIATSTPTAEQIRAACPVALPDLDLDEYGATAVSLCAPTHPLADAASTIGELKDRFPSIPGTTGNIGGEYLNLVFGLQPLLSEMKAYYGSWKDSEKLLDQLEQDSGKWVRRGFTFDPQTSGTVTHVNEPPVLIHGQVPQASQLQWEPREEHRILDTKIWFTGCFTYHLPRSGWRRKLAELDYLYGFKPGIDTAWELTPWSWLVDWQTNVGDVLKNVNAFQSDGLVMPYGYVMCTQSLETNYSQTVYVNDKDVWKKQLLNWRVTTTTAQRRPANPFAFGLTIEDLTPRQLAILAALGISRV